MHSQGNTPTESLYITCSILITSELREHQLKKNGVSGSHINLDGLHMLSAQVEYISIILKQFIIRFEQWKVSVFRFGDLLHAGSYTTLEKVTV